MAGGIARALVDAVLTGVRAALRSSAPKRTPAPKRGPAPERTPAPKRGPAPERPGAAGRGGYAGDATSIPALRYEPFDDDQADPGEIVWAWVPYEEDHSQGKDRPVLVIGRDGNLLLALMLSSQDHDLDAAAEARHGRHWVDIGSGGWDRQGRPSEVRVDRVLRLDPGSVRRQSVALDRERFQQVAAAVRRHARR